jgi:2-polyprenyl-3-methyl-5-hydroxy-6-metoxy-1,4-benzoquinol methylase
MGYRIKTARFLIRLGKFVESLAIQVMKPQDLIKFGCQSYQNPGSVEGWSRRDFVAEGLIPCEKDLLKDIPLKKGSLLLLGMGGGREAIPLAKMGFSVTGVDFVPEMVEKATRNAREQGVEIEGLVQEISEIEISANSYDIVWLCSTMYSCVPTRKKRVEMLRKIRRALKPDGYFVCQFHWEPYRRYGSKSIFIKRLISYLTLGNLAYEKGDILWQNVEFIHIFSSEDNLRSEFEEGGFKAKKIYLPNDSVRGQAILRKPIDNMEV